MKKFRKLFGITTLAVVIGVSMAGCDDGTTKPPDNFVPVTDITGIPSGKQTDVDMSLNGTVVPSTATNKTIVWSISVDDDGSAEPELTGNVLKTASEGTVKVTATIANGATVSTPYTKTFTINVTGEPNEVCQCGGNAEDCECEYCNCEACNGGDDPEKLDITVNFTSSTDEIINLGTDDKLSAGGNLTVTVSGSYASYAWYVDGVEVPGNATNQIVISGEELGEGAHTVTAIVVKDGVPFSKVLNFNK